MTERKSKATSTSTKDVDGYLAALPGDVRATLEELRRTIKAVAPEATEVISYQVPTFKLRGRPLVAFGSGARTPQAAVAKSYCSFYLMSTSVMDAHKDDLKGYDTAKGTVRFPVGVPVPVVLVEKLVKARIAENETGVGYGAGAGRAGRSAG
jgi:uncharacterized protein YdhG (YjbR/CyaY superfamily)